MVKADERGQKLKLIVATNSSQLKQRLAPLSTALLDLHKVLIDSERTEYEQTVGTITSPNHFLRLLTDDPWFAWLHPISLLIVLIDEATEEKKGPLTARTVEDLFTRTRELLVATETGDGFSKHYYEALQREPAVVMAHAEVAKVLRAPAA